MQLIDGQRVSTLTPYGLYGFFGEYSFLSNFEPSPLKLQGAHADGLLYATSEHAYMAMKSHDLAVRHFISRLPTPRLARDAGQVIALREDWASFRTEAMLAAVRAKFTQNPHLAKRLLATGLLYLEETNNWGDRFWGVVEGQGQNMLGKILMQVRTELFEHQDASAAEQEALSV